jgi:sigma-B regulation protein RsbU (phosphoserine phosphatase)
VSTSPRHEYRTTTRSYHASPNDTVRLLLRLQKSAQKINSILDLDELLEEVVEQVCELFGCLETCILLKEPKSNDLIIRATRGCNVHLKGSRFPEGRGLVSHAAALGETIYTPDVSRDARYVTCGHVTNSEIDIPLKVCGRVIGVFNVSHPDLDGFSRQQRQLLEALAEHIAIAVDNATRFQRERLERERMRIEQEDARNIQQAMLPRTSPALEGFRVEGRSIPSGAVGGDFFDYFPIGNGRMGFVLADVSGKGLPAALLMCTTRGILRSLARHSVTAGDILSQLNRILIEDFPAEKFVTMVLAILDPATGILQIANAGHPWPLLVQNGSNGDATRFLASDCGLPLGIMESAYCEAVVRLTSGSSLVIYSDGISERSNDSGEDYGLERLRKIASSHDLSVDAILADADAFAAGSPQNDDSTVIVLQRI